MVQDPTSLEHQQDIENQIEEVAIAASVAIMALIIKSISESEGKTIVEVYASLPKGQQELEAIFTKARNLMGERIDTIFDEMAKANEDWAQQYYEARRVAQKAYKENQALNSIIQDGKDKAKKYVSEHFNSSVTGIVDDDGVFHLMKDAYKQAITSSAAQMISGAATATEAVEKSIKTLSKSGVVVRYKSGVTRELYAAVKTNIMGTYRKTMMDMRERQGLEFGANGVEISAHVPCALDHEPYQGKQYSYAAFNNLQSALGRQLVYGANCHHTISHIILGISRPTYTQSDLKRMSFESQQKVNITGLSGNTLSMTRYEASQYQRKLEQSIRTARTTKYLDEIQGLDTSKIDAEIKQRLAVYKRVSKQSGLPVIMDRTKAYVL